MNDLIFLSYAAGITLSLALSALLVGLLLAITFAAWELSPWKLFARSGSILVTLLRGLPEILVVLFVYYGSSHLLITISDLLSEGITLFDYTLTLDLAAIEVSPFFCGVIALALLYAAYASQTIRGALLAVPLSQRESGQALGLNKFTVFWQIVLPQMWRHALPGLGNQWLVLLKDTALVSLISVNDLMLQAKSIAIRTKEPFTWYLAVAAIYLIITLLSQYILRRIEQRTTRFERSLADV